MDKSSDRENQKKKTNGGGERKRQRGGGGGGVEKKREREVKLYSMQDKAVSQKETAIRCLKSTRDNAV